MTEGPAVSVIEGAVEQVEFDAIATLPTVLVTAGVLFGAGLLWRLVRKYVKP